jgi:NAD(P)H-hydrate repair Nnr-like enzyme with NAD(P)H-hydrate dehydratase domain
MTPVDASVAATYLHATAAELACRDYGGHGLIAGDLIPYLPAALSALCGG